MLLAFTRRSEEGTNTLLSSLNIRVHSWIRELNRMVMSLPADPNPMDTAPHGDTNRDEVPDGYNAEVQNQEIGPPPHLLAQAPDETLVSGSKPIPGHGCFRCLRWQTSTAGRHDMPPGMCAGCNDNAWHQAWRMAPDTGVHEGLGRWRTWACAYCGPATGLRIFGIASTSMTSFPTSTPFTSTVHQDPKLLVGISTKTEAGFVVAVPGSDTLQPSCVLGLAT